MEIIKTDGDFSIVKNEKNRYEVHCEKEALWTPSGCTAYTMYLPVAERLLEDWKKYGYESYTEPYSILSYHFTMQDNFSKYPKADILNMLNSLNWEKNWTFQSCPSGDPEVWMKWVSYFGQTSSKVDLVKQWLENQTLMQLTASTCVYNAFMSYNVAYFFAIVVEEMPKTKHKKAIKEFYEFYNMFDPYFSFKNFWAIFECFRLYYGIHVEEHGKHLPQPKVNS